MPVSIAIFAIAALRSTGAVTLTSCIGVACP
jgi:hypothetical protein